MHSREEDAVPCLFLSNVPTRFSAEFACQDAKNFSRFEIFFRSHENSQLLFSAQRKEQLLAMLAGSDDFSRAKKLLFPLFLSTLSLYC